MFPVFQRLTKRSNIGVQISPQCPVFFLVGIAWLRVFIACNRIKCEPVMALRKRAMRTMRTKDGGYVFFELKESSYANILAIMKYAVP
jgi:hypothetical protein